MHRSIPRSLLLLALLSWAGPAHGQNPGAGIPLPPLADSTLSRIAEEIALPPGLEMAVVAAAPQLTYPVVVEPAEPGVLFVATDPNLIFGRQRHRGRILRLVDGDGDGAADRYTVFADSLDGVRGLVYDGGTLYVVHAPTLSALRDGDGDGVADEERILVEGLGFGLDDRGGDHSVNGIRLGIDGWLYVAVGDYGFLGATGTDGTRLRLHSGGVIRVRPDGTEMEIVARGTRNIYDFALDPQLRIFARDNTNNGQGWNSRLHYLPDGADVGYPSRFRNFPAEIFPPLADLGAGAATTSLWIDDPSFPGGAPGTLFTADWALNRIYRHDLVPRGATFSVTQSELISVPHPADMELDDRANLFIASLSGGSYDYGGEGVGYVVRVRPRAEESAATGGSGGSASGSDLVARLLGGSSVARLRAQRELLRRGPGAEGVARLRAAIADSALPLPGRVAAIFTLVQLDPSGSRPLLLEAARDPEIRAMALRALADRRADASSLPVALFAQAIDAPDPFVRVQAVNALARIGTPQAAAALMRAAASPDSTIAHLARNLFPTEQQLPLALTGLASRDPDEHAAALSILSRVHSPGVVEPLLARLRTTADPARREALLLALARLAHREGPWDGSWWGNQPDTEGPYFQAERWEESERISAELAAALVRAEGEEVGRLVGAFVREGVLPRASEELAGLLAASGEPLDDALLTSLVGRREPSPEALGVLERRVAANGRLRVPALRMLVAVPVPADGSLPLLSAAASDEAVEPELRAAVLGALARATSPAGMTAALGAHTAVLSQLPENAALLQSWRRFTTDRRRVEEIERYAGLIREGSRGEQVLAWGVLVQLASTSRNPEPVRTRAGRLIDEAWGTPAAEPLARAIRLLGVEERYREKL